MIAAGGDRQGRSRVPVAPTAVASPAATAGDAGAGAGHVRGAPLPSVPPLPFADNPDPTQCGIPAPWGKDDPAWITGIYLGEVVQPVVPLR